MRASSGKISLFLGLVLVLSACAGGKDGMLNLRAGKVGPDEFSVLPTKPLQTPTDLASLPPPTPGGSNITDPTPNADAVAALGGNPERLTRSSAPASEAALVNYTLRYGVQAGIREELAAADKQLRESNGLYPTFGNFGNLRYYRIYKSEALDQYKELERLRALGIRTPSAPPAE